MASNLEGLIDSTLAEHWRASVELTDDGGRFKCQCGHGEPTLGSGHGSTTTWSRDHQARAVLAALTEAGSVQFGVKGEARVKEYGRDRRRAQLAAKGRQATFVSRIVGPWTEVAG